MTNWKGFGRKAVVAQSRCWPPSVLERLRKHTKSSVRTYGDAKFSKFTATNKQELWHDLYQQCDTPYKGKVGTLPNKAGSYDHS